MHGTMNIKFAADVVLILRILHHGQWKSVTFQQVQLKTASFLNSGEISLMEHS